MDGLLEELLRLEKAKHAALILIDAPAYDENVREQMRLLEVSKQQLAADVTRVETLFSLSQLISLNTRLLQNLMATSPFFESMGYTAAGVKPVLDAPSRVVVEA